MYLEDHSVHRKNSTSAGNQRVPMGGRLKERPSSYISMKTGTGMQIMAKLKSPQNPLLWKCLICLNYKHCIDLHVTLSPLISS